jgi:serine/threonine-protein kinase
VRTIVLSAVGAAVVIAGVLAYMLVGPGAYTSVPDVLGDLQAAALATLSDAGLHPTATQVFDDAAAGTVVSTTPKPSGRVRKGGAVTVAVSKGPDLVAVPAKLVGTMQADAKAALDAVGLTADYAPDKHYDDTAPIGAVLAADKQPGDMIKRHSTVILTLSDGPAPLTIFSVAGATQQQAEKDLNGAGLKMAIGTPAFSDTVPAGSVISQDPAAGTPGHRTNTVTVVISQGPPMVVVPDVTGKKFNDAKTALEALGVTVVRQQVFPYFGGPNGTVYQQSVPANTSVQKGSTITLTVV